MVTDTDAVVEQSPFLMSTSYLNEGKIKFLKIIQETIRQTCCQEHKRRLCKCNEAHMGYHRPFSTSIYRFWAH